MSFWAQKLGAPPAAPAPTPTVAPQEPQAGPWWSQPAYRAPAPAPAPVAAPEATQATTKARSARMTDFCPDCGSENYFSRRQDGNGLKQCYECGYNDRFTHSTHGAGLPGGTNAGPSTPSRQVPSGGAGGKSNFHPGTIIGHI